MALQKNIKLTDNFGIEVEIPNAYIRVEYTECSKKESRYNLSINKKDENEIRSLSNVYDVFDYDINGENPIKQAYLYLKTLPEFADAVDC